MRVIAALAFFILHPSSFILFAQPPEPPLAGRPENFSHLVGAYRITTSAVPTAVCVEDPLILTVRITGQGPKEYQPRRDLLRIFPADFTQHFFVEELPQQDRHLPAEKAWEFVWRLRPKQESVAEVPALELIYYRFGKYQTSLAPSLALTVKPRPAVEVKGTPEFVAAQELPDRFYQWQLGSEVPPYLPEDSFPSAALLLVLAGVPPLLCAVWYWLWRRHGNYEVAARRRSRAASSALQALAQPEEAAQVVKVVEVMDEYLRQRFDFAAAEPTPTEAARHLFRLGASRPLQQRLADFFGACDTARFAPARGPDRLADQAAQLIIALEAELCGSQLG